MAAKRDMQSILVATIESTEGTAASATNSTDVILCENLMVKFNQSVQSTAEHTGTLDPATDIPIGGPAEVTFDTWLKGSGTAGTAPEIGKLLKACGWGETTTGAALQGTSTGTAGVNSIDLSAGTFAGATGAYNGMVAQLLVNPAGIFTAITDWTTPRATLAETFSPTLDSTTQLVIPKNVLYSPISTAIPAITLRGYKSDLLSTVAGCRGTFKMQWVAGKGIKLSWRFLGIHAMPRTDTSNPTNASPDSAQSKLVWRNDSDNGGFTLNGARCDVGTLNFDLGVAIDNAPNPNKASGFDVADIGARVMKFDIDPNSVAISSRDSLAQVRAGSTYPVHAFARNSAGNGVSFLMPAAQPTSIEYAKGGTRLVDKISGKATGKNTGAYLCFF